MGDIIVGREYQHIKKGTRYRVIGISNLDADEDRKDFIPHVFYIATDLKLWSRPLQVFIDRYRLIS